jgi:antitoxin VapB
MDTTVFWSGHSQAIRIPKELRLRSNTAEIFREGDRIIIREKKALTWTELCTLECSDFELVRPDNGAPQERELF